MSASRDVYYEVVDVYEDDLESAAIHRTHDQDLQLEQVIKMRSMLNKVRLYQVTQDGAVTTRELILEAGE